MFFLNKVTDLGPTALLKQTPTRGFFRRFSEIF